MRTDTNGIQGKWECVSLQLGHEQLTEEVKGLRVVITDSKIAFHYTEDCKTFTFALQLDPTKSPKQIQMSGELDGVVQTMRGVYRLEGDSLEICVGPEDGVPPSEFRMDKDKRFQLMRLTRAP